MANYLRPRRGKKSTAIAQAVVLKRGEVFFECPDSGVGSGYGNIKVGDGSTTYANLPYFMTTAEDSTVAFTDTSSATDSSNNPTYLTNIAPANTIKTIFTNLKQLLYNYNSQLTQLNNDLSTANKNITTLNTNYANVIVTSLTLTGNYVNADTCTIYQWGKIIVVCLSVKCVTPTSSWILANSNLPKVKNDKTILSVLTKLDGNTIGVYIGNNNNNKANLNFIAGIANFADFWGTICYITE